MPSVNAVYLILGSLWWHYVNIVKKVTLQKLEDWRITFTFWEFTLWQFVLEYIFLTPICIQSAISVKRFFCLSAGVLVHKVFYIQEVSKMKQTIISSLVLFKVNPSLQSHLKWSLSTAALLRINSCTFS